MFHFRFLGRLKKKKKTKQKTVISSKAMVQKKFLFIHRKVRLFILFGLQEIRSDASTLSALLS